MGKFQPTPKVERDIKRTVNQMMSKNQNGINLEEFKTILGSRMKAMEKDRE